jgi:hypothetical protein
MDERLEIRMFSEQINTLLAEENSLRHLLPINSRHPQHFFDVIRHGLVPLYNSSDFLTLILSLSLSLLPFQSALINGYNFLRKLLEMNESIRWQYCNRHSVLAHSLYT